MLVNSGDFIHRTAAVIWLWTFILSIFAFPAFAYDDFDDDSQDSPQETREQAETRNTVADLLAEIFAKDVDSAARLSIEGEFLYTNDNPKRTGYEYCSIAVRLANDGVTPPLYSSSE